MRCASKVLGIILCGLLGSQWSDSMAAVDLEGEVRSLLADRCQKCHGPEKQKGGRRLDLRDAMRNAGDSGEAAVVPGHADESELIRRITSADELERMPPTGPPLPEEGVRLLKRRIDEGATWSGVAKVAAYGLDSPASRSFGSKCLPARRLVERGLFDSTLVIWGGEFGRMPVSEGKQGRDHNPHGFLVGMAGAGIKGGVSHGETDEIGYEAAVDPVSVNDLHATMLHLLGLDHMRLTHLLNGRRCRLTDVAGNVLTRILA